MWVGAALGKSSFPGTRSATRNHIDDDPPDDAQQVRQIFRRLALDVPLRDDRRGETRVHRVDRIGGHELAGDPGDLTELLSQIEASDADLVVLNWDVLGQRIDMLLDLLELFEKPPAIVGLSVRAENEQAAKKAGLAGFTHKGEPPERLLEVIREVSRAREP